MTDGSPPDENRWKRLRWFLETDDEAVELVRETGKTLLVVAAVGALLFAVSGVWPPMVAVESGSMQPNMETGDLVFVVDDGRFAPADAHGDTGVVTARRGEQSGHSEFGRHGDVVVFRPNGNAQQTPIIHRAEFWVNESENWYGKADPAHLSGDSCADVPNCPAPYAGFVTKGDHNARYDQVNGNSDPVRPSWIRGTAEVRVPYLGYVRLALA